MAQQSGWERLLYYGVAGSTAATQITTAKGVNVDRSGTAFHSTKVRGDGSALPIETERPTDRKCVVTFTIPYDSTDATLASLIAAAEADAPTDVALKVDRASGGLTEVDADFYLEYTSPGELEDGMDVEFTGHLSRDSGRTPTVVSA